MKELDLSNQSLPEILKQIASEEGKHLKISFGAESILQNSENKKVVEAFAHKHGKSIEFEKPAAPVVAEPVGDIESIGGVKEVREAETDQLEVKKETEDTLEEAIKKDQGHLPVDDDIEAEDAPEFAVNKDLANGEELSEETSQHLDHNELAEPEPAVAPHASIPILQEDNSDRQHRGRLPSFASGASQLSWPLVLSYVKNNRLVVTAVVGSLVIFLGGLLLFWYIPSAQVDVTVTNKSIDREITLVAATNGSIDGNTISLNKSEIKNTASLDAKATGRKTVGEKSKGKVTIRNYSVVNDASLPAGTQLKVLGGDGDGLTFVTVVAAKAPHGTQTSTIDADGTITVSNKPGKVDVEVEALDLGSKFDQPSGTKFSVNNQSTTNIDAVAATDLAGGKSEEKQVVTATDQKTLLDSLKGKLESEGKMELSQKIGQGQKLIDATVKTEISKQEFSKKVDEEAETFKLDLEGVTRGYYYIEDEAKRVLKENLQKIVPEGYKLDDSNINYELSVVSSTDDKINLKGAIKATLLPNLDTNDLRNSLVSKPLSEVEEFFKNNESVTGTNITLQPAYYQGFNKMPPRASNIKVSFKSQ